jgi:hypothetical protein
MIKKKMFSVGITAMFAVVALFAMAGTASATGFGNCLESGKEAALCGSTHQFQEFAPGTYHAVITKKPGSTPPSELETPAFGSKLVCTGLSGQGVDINTGVHGISEQALVFEKCSGVGPALEKCQDEIALKKQKLNGTEKLIGSVKAEAINSTEQEISPTGFNTACTEGTGSKTGVGAGETTKEFGTVTGTITCKTVPTLGKQYELHCEKATGLIFGGAASNQTGFSEAVEAFYPSGKIYQK